MSKSEIQIGQRGHHIDLATVLCQATQPGPLETELLLDHPEWGSPDFVDTDQGFTRVSVRVALNCFS